MCTVCFRSESEAGVLSNNTRQLHLILPAVPGTGPEHRPSAEASRVQSKEADGQSGHCKLTLGLRTEGE